MPTTRTTPHDPANNPKRELRRSILDRVREMPPSVAKAQAESAQRLLIGTDLFASASALMLYISIPGEPELFALCRAAVAAGKAVCVPDVNWEDRSMVPRRVASLESCLPELRHGIPVPPGDAPLFPIDQLGLIVVPGVAFDRQGGRLGRGGGFYDRFLSRPEVRARAVAVAFEPQIVDAVPLDSWDRPLDAVVTPGGIFFRTPSDGSVG